jgi:hypothetical protein
MFKTHQTRSYVLRRLCAYVATKVRPPRYLEAVDSYGPVIKENAHDYEAVSHIGI